MYKGVSRRHVRVGVWYLVAFCQACQAFQTFRLSYIEDVKVCEEAISFQPDFDLQAYWQEAREHLEEQVQPVALKLHVTSTARHKIRGDFTVLREEPDGSAVVRVHVESIEAAVSYALAMGADATVLSPARVRDAVAATAHVIAEMYSQ